ncbi:hypothetical protein EGW08_013174 [Elysia chlorotica]|uniref:Uncharacterized protein n=1 Tax=Elysia chlorotica TaxID=188477 RepID=A0A3S0ZNI3_ELYCH|nr:hypothetical protein EGW08_013174 [Elysia chlorotica]
MFFEGENFIIGEKIYVTCRSLLGLHGQIKFYIVGNDSSMDILSFDKEAAVLNYTEDRKIDWNGKCNRFAVARLSLLFNRQLDGKSLACVSNITDNIPICSSDDKFCTKLKKFDFSTKEKSYCLSCVILDYAIIIAPIVLLLLVCLCLVYILRAKFKPPAGDRNTVVTQKTRSSGRESLSYDENDDAAQFDDRKYSRGSEGSKGSKGSKESRGSRGTRGSGGSEDNEDDRSWGEGSI